MISTLFDIEIFFETPCFYSVIIENKKLNYDVCRYLYNEFCDKNEYFAFFNDDKKLDISNESAFIYNLFSLDLNTKKNINALYKILKKTIPETLQDDIKNIRESIFEVVKKISLEFEIELNVNSEIREDDLFKIIDLRFSENDDSLLLRFKKYIETIYELINIKVFFTYRLHEYFEKDELNLLTHELFYKNISIINIEQSNNFEKTRDETFVIVDHDLCVIE